MFENFNNCMDFSRNDPYLFSADLQLHNNCCQYFEIEVKIKWLRNLRLIFGQSCWKLVSKFRSPYFNEHNILSLILSCHLEKKVFAFPQILKSYRVPVSQKSMFQQKSIYNFPMQFLSSDFQNYPLQSHRPVWCMKIGRGFATPSIDIIVRGFYRHRKERPRGAGFPAKN